MASEYWSIPGTPIPENPAEDPELSSHIRHLLLAYVQTHITTPYAQFTQLAVSNLLSALKPISVHDPTALTLPTDPLTVYLSTFASTVEPYTEKLQTTNEARLLIKRLLASKPPRVAKFADKEDEENYGYHRPTTPPILTRRAIRETPVIGKTPEAVKTYAAYTKTALHHALRPVPLQEITEPQVNFDQVLDVKHYIRAEDHAAVRALLKSAAKPPAPAHIHAYLPSSLVGDSHITQEHTPPPDSPPFMPIFPRRVPICPPGKGKRRRNSRGRSTGPTKRHNSGPTPQAIPESMKDLSLLVKAAVVNEGGEKANTDACGLDLCEDNMVVVDGWQTYVTSSPSVLSSNSNEEEDQLFLPSSPDTDVGAVALVKAVEDSKLEEVLIPRSRKIGSKPFVNGEKVKDPGVGRAINAGYGRFLAPLLQSTSGHRNSTTLSITSGKPSSPQIQVTLDTEQTDVDLDSSLLGQASGLSDLHANGNNDDDGDAEIRQLYTRTSVPLPIQNLGGTVGGLQASEERPKPLSHPHDFIRDEPLFDDDVGKGGKDGVRTSKDSKDSTQGLVGALIPVPNLPEPNTYTATHTKAATLAEYVAPIGGNSKNVGDRSRGFLRKAKGIAGLRVALSWVPFTLSSPADLPDHARVVDVNVLHRNDTDEMRRSEEKLVQGLLKRAAVIEDPALDDDGGKFQSVGEHLWSVLGDDDGGDRLSLESCEGLPPYDIILTREERMGLEKREKGIAKRDGLVQAEAREEEEELDEDGDEANVQSGIDNGHLKRKGVYSREIPDNDVSRSRKKRRSQDPNVVNDSGIEMMDGGCVPTDNAEAEADILDFDIEGEDPFGSGAGGEDAFGVDDEKENRRPVGGLEAHDGYISDPGMGDQDYYEWKGEEQNAASRITRNDDFYYQSPRRKLDDDYSRGFSLHQYYDAPLNPQVYARSNQHLPDGANGLLDTGFGQTHYIELDDGHDVDMNDGYDYGRPNDGLDYVEGSFEPLPLSFDSQSYQAVSVRSSQVQAPPGRLSIQGQPHPQVQVSHANDRSNELTTEDSQDTQASNELATDSHTETTDTLTRAMVTSIQVNSPQAPRRTNLPSNGPLLDLDLATHSLGIAAFARLRAKTLKQTPSDSTNPTPSRELQVQTPPMSEPRAPRNPPAGLYDRRTLRLPSELRVPPTTTHKYLASLDLLQKRALVRDLRSPEHRIDLVERVTLDGADLILDAHVALIFVPLLSLPAQTQAEALLARVARVSWAFERLLVVFEAYPASRSVRASRLSSSIAVSAPSAAQYHLVALSASPPSVPASSGLSLSGRSNISTLSEPGIYAYTPPIMKAIRKFRRDLDISEACGTKSAACVVEYAFADSVTEAAGFSRMFGDMVEVEGTRERGEGRNHLGDVRWGDRAWLDLDPDEDEDGLAAVPGMNRFKAAAVLSQMTLGDFLDLDLEERVQMFGGIVGVRSVMAFNEEIERRLGALENYEEQNTSVQVPDLG